MQNRKMTGMIP